MKTTKEMISIMQAYVDGKEIEYTNKNSPMDWLKTKDPLWDWNASDYRVKQAPEYVPFTFEDAEFLIGKVVRDKSTESIEMITWCDKTMTSVADYKVLIEEFTFLDGSPCGKLKQ